MKSENQLLKTTNKWLVMLLITLGIASAFYWLSIIRVDNILHIEFSQNLDKFNTNIKAHFSNIKANTLYDFIFILAYTVLFYLTYRMFQTSMRIKVSKLWIILCLLPGVLDIIENVVLLSLINDSQNSWIFNLFWLVVRAKWTLVIPFIFINFTIVIYYLIRFINSFFS